MADGRFLSKTIAADAQLAQLSAEAEMLYLKCVPHLDRDGMVMGDPVQLLATISPLRFSQLASVMADVVEEWVRVGLVLRFATPAGLALFFKGFLKNQTLRYDRERPSLYPPPPGYIHTANGLRPATDVPWVDSSVDQSSNETPGYYPKTPAECPVLPESQSLDEDGPETATNGVSAATPGYNLKTPAKTAFLPESALQAESASESAPKQKDTGKQQQAEAAAAGLSSDCRRLLVDFGIAEPSLGRILAKRQGADHVRGWLVVALQASQRRRKPIDDPVAFAVARLLSGDPPVRLVSAEEYETEPDDDPNSYEALKRRYIPDGWEDVVRH